MKKLYGFYTATILTVLVLAIAVQAQTSGFTYQGRFTDSTVQQPTSGTYQMEFALFDAVSGGNQIGATITNSTVQVANGIFTVNLDFGANSFDGAARFLEIRVFNTATSAFVSLTPRQAMTSAPYSIRSSNAGVATNALNLGGVAANQFIREGDLRLTDSRPSSSVNFSTAQLSGIVPVTNGGTGSTTQNFVDLSTAQINIGGDKTFSGTLSGNIVNATTQYNIGGSRVLSVGGISNTFAGVGAGAPTQGGSNSFFGRDAGFSSTSAAFNSFFGRDAGRNNIDGNRNSFFGRNAGISNTTGFANTIIGSDADVGSGDLRFATAIGVDAVVSTSNTIQLGRATGNDRVLIPGQLSSTGQIIAGGGIALNDTEIRLFGATDTNHIFSYDAGFNGILSRSFEFQWRRFNNGGNTLMILANNGVLVTIGGFQQSSDARYKTNVQTFAGALDAVRRLRGVTFNWKPEQNKNPDTQIGFIAQEVEAVLPELVSTDKEGYKSVSYSNTVPVLVEAVKEQQTQIDEQTSLIKRQEEKLTEQEKQLRQQQAEIDLMKQFICSQTPTAPFCKKEDK